MADTTGTLQARPRVLAGALPVVAFGATMLVSATLLFLIQPMFAKMILPLLGGTPAVWNTSMLFFQTALLAGYAYAHFSITRLGVRRQLVVHLVLVAVSLVFLPVAIPAGWEPGTANPALWLLALLTIAIGLPFFVISATAPTLQRWFASIGHRSSGDPYFLYAASNVGSMAALLAYPLLVEPSLRLADQGRAWSAVYVLFAVALGGSAVVTWWRGQSERVVLDAVRPSGLSDAKPDVKRRMKWLLLALVPSSHMLGVTTFLTTDIAAVPLLWVVPLTLYLLSFVIVFSRRSGALVRLATRRLPLLLLGLAAVLILGATGPIWIIIPLHLTAFFVTAVVLHGRLAGDRPDPRYLTQFYLWMSLGGALGGLFNALIAPVLFNTLLEYRIVVVAAALMMPSYSREPRFQTRDLRDVALPIGVGAFALLAAELEPTLDFLPDGVVGRIAVFGLPVLACLSFDRRPLRFGLGIGALLLASTISGTLGSNVIYSDRSFFGIHRVEDDGGIHGLVHGSTVHGRQDRRPGRTTVPLTYYHRTGPLGDVFGASLGVERTPTVGVVGLGTGTMSCYKRPGERWTFYEIDPRVVEIARDRRLFTFLRECAPDAAMITGDARISLRSTPDEGFGLLVIDAFSSDAIPIHLISAEAVDLYASKLADGGVLLFHISNRYLDLRTVTGNLAAHAGLAAAVNEDLAVPRSLEKEGKAPSVWVAMAAERTTLQPLYEEDGWRTLRADPDGPLWTDDFSNILGVFE